MKDAGREHMTASEEVRELAGEAGFVAVVSLLLMIAALSFAGVLIMEGSVPGLTLGLLCTVGGLWLGGTACGSAFRWGRLDAEAERLRGQEDAER